MGKLSPRIPKATALGIIKSHSANGPWDKSLNFIFPTKHVIIIPESLKFSHWLSELRRQETYEENLRNNMEELNGISHTQVHSHRWGIHTHAGPCQQVYDDMLHSF